MSESKIEWTNRSWNPVRGCVKVSPGCKNCYAETFAERWRGVPGHPYEQGFDLRLVPHKLKEPLTVRKPQMWFVNSMSDLFQDGVPFEYIAAVFGVMAARPDHTFQILTKRAKRMLEWFKWVERGNHLAPDDPLNLCRQAAWEITGDDIADNQWPLPNVWLGVSAENQKTADERIPLLLQCPAAVRWASAEPLLGPINFREIAPWDDFYTDAFDTPDFSFRLHWVVTGGESGNKARACNVDWVRDIVRQCRETGTPVFVKQLGRDPMDHNTTSAEWFPDENLWPNACLNQKDNHHVILKHRKGGDPNEWPEDLRVRQWPEVRA